MKFLIVILALVLSNSWSCAQSSQALLDRVPAQSLIDQFRAPLGIAPPGDARPISKLALGLIKEFEGWYPDTYNDPAGYCTIGFGHLIALRQCNANDRTPFNPLISKEAGETLLEADTVAARSVVQQAVRVELNNDQFGALSSFAFNVGGGKFLRSTLLKVVNSGKFEFVGQELMRWTMAGGNVLPGLVARRACEGLMFAGRLKFGKSGELDRNNCGILGVAPSYGSLIDINVGEF